MKILIVGAGATGGAFGTLLQEAGRDITYLVRAPRAVALQRDGLRFVSPSGDRTHTVQTLVSGEPSDPFDLIILTVKAGALESAIADLRPYLGPGSFILPILNGLKHIHQLEQEFPGQILGGLAKIVATLEEGVVRQMTGLTTLTIGSPAHPGVPARIENALTVPGIALTVSPDITGALWDKWVFIAAAGIITCLFRGPVGKIIDAGGLPQIIAVIAETEAVAAAAGHTVSQQSHTQSKTLLTEAGSAFTSSLYRDLTAGLPTEAEHILGDLARQAQRHGVATSLLDLALIQIRTNA
ncbi:ketopantoate reductase family protein [Specibacter sp. NPDC057265]|uniref:ketopantoate reductase family protein n=1 Tax=Specibacter sp. NPDC057265 TaxID=3346075 RepID=UPI0036358D23